MRGLQNKSFLSFLLPSWLVFQVLSFLEHQNSLCLPHSFPAIPSYLMQREEKGLGSEGREKVDQYEWVQRFVSRGQRECYSKHCVAHREIGS